MRNLIYTIKSINIKQILIVFLAGCLLTVSTACSQDSVAQTESKAGMEMAKISSDTYDDYDANQKFKGGMNGYNDDVRYDDETAARTKKLIDAAKSNQNDTIVDDLDKIPERVGDKIQQAQREIPRTVQENTEKAVDYVQDKAKDLQENLSQVSNDARKVANEARNNAQDAVEGAAQATERKANEIKNNVRDLT